MERARPNGRSRAHRLSSKRRTRSSHIHGQRSAAHWQQRICLVQSDEQQLFTTLSQLTNHGRKQPFKYIVAIVSHDGNCREANAQFRAGGRQRGVPLQRGPRIVQRPQRRQPSAITVDDYLLECPLIPTCEGADDLAAVEREQCVIGPNSAQQAAIGKKVVRFVDWEELSCGTHRIEERRDCVAVFSASRTNVDSMTVQRGSACESSYSRSRAYESVHTGDTQAARLVSTLTRWPPRCRRQSW